MLETDIFDLLLSMLKLLLIILFISHWGACFWYFVGDGEQDQFGYSWIKNARLLDKSIYEKYISSLYYFITTMSTVITNYKYNTYLLNQRLVTEI